MKLFCLRALILSSILVSTAFAQTAGLPASEVDCIANAVAESTTVQSAAPDAVPLNKAIEKCIGDDYACTDRATGGTRFPHGVNDCAKCTRNTCWSCCDEFTNYPNKAFLDCLRVCCEPGGYNEQTHRCTP